MYSLVQITIVIGESVTRDIEGIERDVFVSPEKMAVLAYQYFMGHKVVSVQNVSKQGRTTMVALEDHTKQNITVMVTITDKLTEVEKN